ncbi:hypothetical protein HZA33_01290 [Candidatus Pacearchaeota archaeon]|nr:hypothetical protein [Candidatus Pacearchaeota archaeon]
MSNTTLLQSRADYLEWVSKYAELAGGEKLCYELDVKLSVLLSEYFIKAQRMTSGLTVEKRKKLEDFLQNSFPMPIREPTPEELARGKEIEDYYKTELRKKYPFGFWYALAHKKDIESLRGILLKNEP